jgi:hypothetical protein
METHPPRPNRALAELLNACQTSPLTDKDGTERTYSDSSDITGVAAAGQARVTERHAARGGRARRGVPSYQIPIWSGNESLGGCYVGGGGRRRRPTRHSAAAKPAQWNKPSPCWTKPRRPWREPPAAPTRRNSTTPWRASAAPAKPAGPSKRRSNGATCRGRVAHGDGARVGDRGGEADQRPVQSPKPPPATGPAQSMTPATAYHKKCSPPTPPPDPASSATTTP